MRSVPLFGASAIENLLIDPTFTDGSPGIGRWYANLGTSLNGDGPAIVQTILSASPLGMSLPVGSIADAPETGSPRTISLIAQVPGGEGPYAVSLWLSTEKPVDDPLALVRVSVANAASTGLSGVEIPFEATAARTVGGRVWHRVRGEAPGPFAMGAYLVIRFRPSTHRWLLQAPEIVPRALLPTEAPMMLVGKPIELEPAELAAIAAYRRIPLDLGVAHGAPTNTSNIAR
jgi:hypothetical protein